MSTPHASPATTTATRSGSRVVVTRTDEGLIAGTEPIVAVMVDSADVLAFTPETALALAGMLARAATDTIAVQILVTNSYPDATFTHVYDVTVPAHRDHDYATDWMFDHLWEYVGEGPEYSSVPAVYEVEILSAPAHFEYLVGMKVDSYG